MHALVTLLLLLPFRSRRRRRGRRGRRRCTFKEQDPGRSLALPVDGVQLHLEDEIWRGKRLISCRGSIGGETMHEARTKGGGWGKGAGGVGGSGS